MKIYFPSAPSFIMRFLSFYVFLGGVFLLSPARLSKKIKRAGFSFAHPFPLSSLNFEFSYLL